MVNVDKDKKSIEVKRRSRGAYTNEEKMEAVRLLIDNGYNYYKTTQQTGVGRPSLKLWLDKYGSTFQTDAQVRSVATTTEMRIANIKGNFIRDKYEKIGKLADAAIAKAMELIPKETDLGKVTGIIKAINEFVRSSSDEEKGEADNSAHQIMIEKAIMQINQAAQL